jgi:deazaflavin-dependent oxidoreductase (nitroreductase family)
MEKLFINLNVWLYRLLRGGPMTSHLLLLTVRGRKTGRQRTTPLGYFRDGETFIVIASNGGQQRHPIWYLNLVATPTVEVQVGARRFQARAETAQGDERTRLWKTLATINPGYEKMQQKNTLVFPVVRLTPIG